MMRRLILLVAALACTTANADQPKLVAKVDMVADTTVRVITSWGYRQEPSGGFPDSTRVKVGIGQSPPASNMGKFVKWPKTVDTTLVTVSAYGTIQGYSCVVPHRREKWGSQTCTNWQWVRPDVTVPPFDSVSGGVALMGIWVRPAGMQVDPDVNGACKTWQAANPSKTPWVTVNLKAVSQCTGPNNQPTVAQFCAFYMRVDSSYGMTSNSENIPYCQEIYPSWVREVAS